MKKGILLILLVAVFSSFQKPKTLKGTWQFCGGYFNGKPNPAPKDYILQRKYTNTNYEAVMLEKGEEPYKYEAGEYKLMVDTCLETQRFSALPTQVKDITIHFAYTLRHDTLVLKATLPSGYVAEDYWKKVK